MERLQKDLPIITTPEAAEKIAEKGFTAAVALETWDSAIVDKLDSRVVVTSMPGKHGPALTDLLLPHVMGSMLQFESRNGSKMLSLYISGDTLVFDQSREIPQRYPDIDLGLFHLGDRVTYLSHGETYNFEVAADRVRAA